MFDTQMIAYIVLRELKIGVHQRMAFHLWSINHHAETIEILQSVLDAAGARNDDGDLLAAEAVYHHHCQVQFHIGRDNNTKR